MANGTITTEEVFRAVNDLKGDIKSLHAKFDLVSEVVFVNKEKIKTQERGLLSLVDKLWILAGSTLVAVITATLSLVLKSG